MRLELTRRSDYAVRAMTFLAGRRGELVTSARIQEATDIPARFVVPVMSDLARAELVETVLGRSGGYRLDREPMDISVLAVVTAVEGVEKRTLCALNQRLCGAVRCRLHVVLERANEAFRAELDATSLASLVSAQPVRSAAEGGPVHLA